MYFVGLDLAWGERNQTGVAVVDADGKLHYVGSATDDDSITAAIGPYVEGDCIVAIDAPLIVPNATGHRPAERALNRDFQRFDAGARPAFNSKSEFKHPRGARLAEALALDMDPGSSARRRAIEVYPHPAAVVLFDLPKTLKYKRGAFDDRHRELLKLMDLIEGLDDASPRLRVNRSAAWVELRRRVDSATRPMHLERDEDPIDAVLCAYVALYWYCRPEDVTIYGDFGCGYIVTPSLPGGAPDETETAPLETPVPSTTPTRPPQITHHAPSDAVAQYESRRPTLVAATDHYLQIVINLLDEAGINYLSVTARTKTVESFAAKAERRTNAGEPLYTNPLNEITDQVGLRIITYVREDVGAVANLLADEMTLIDDRDMGLETAREGRWGYASRHLLVGVEGERQPASIQVRTVLQHAWAEFEHDVRYKGTIPAAHVPDLDRRFTLAAGLLELADSEFTAIRERLRSTVTDSDAKWSQDQRIATPVLATYLGGRYPDAGWSRTDHYAWISGLLLELGITSLDELTSVLDGIDESALSRALAYRFPPGAVRRLDDVLLATFSDQYIRLLGNAHRIELLRNRFERLGRGVE